MDEIVKYGNLPLKEDRPIYVVVCDSCKDAFRTNDRREYVCAECNERLMDEYCGYDQLWGGCNR